MSIETLVAQLQVLVDRWDLREAELIDWFSGEVGGGQNADGLYPITSRQGITSMVPCPAQVIHDAQSSTGAAAQSASAASSARAAAETARDQAQASATLADNARLNAQSHRDLAESAASQALNSANSAASLISSRFPDSASLRIPQSSTPTPSTEADDWTFRVDNDFLYIRTANGWRRVPLEVF